MMDTTDVAIFIIGAILGGLLTAVTFAGVGPSDMQRFAVICEYLGGESADGPNKNDYLCIKDNRVLDIDIKDEP